jgi:inner membrane protein
MKSLKTNIMFKIAIIFILVVVLLIPATMVKGLIKEREYVQKEAISEVSEKWGEGQKIIGPYISIPYDKYIKQRSANDTTEKIVKIREWLYFLPETLDVEGEIFPEKRYRGIYEIVVYESDFTMSGEFKSLDWKLHDINKNNIHFDKATLNIGISDLKGIENQVELNWNNQMFSFNSGVSSTDLVYTGVNAPVLVKDDDSTTYKFSLTFNLKGSQHLYFTPVGKTTDVHLLSKWTTPSFTGTYLPDYRDVHKDGFNAHWNILHLNRNYPQSFTNSTFSISGNHFGTDLLLPVDSYKKSYRVANYSILFIVLTFLVFFFVEILNRVFIHPIQYLLVGVALIVFYSLLLSFSEHIKFNTAYISATILTLLLVTGYTKAILKSNKISLLIFGILLILYTFIFTIIQLEDYALLIGSVGMFVVLAIVMYFSRKIDWYNIKINESKE